MLVCSFGVVVVVVVWVIVWVVVGSGVVVGKGAVPKHSRFPTVKEDR